MLNIRALIFDMDGVIVDSNPWHRLAWQKYNRGLGVEMTEAMQQKMYGKRNDELIREFFALGFSTVICCVNDAYLGEAAVGCKMDENFVALLPAEVDPCGENGEFHSFAYAGPIFKQPVPFALGEKVYRPVEQAHPTDANSSYVCPPSPHRTTGFWFCDLLPVPANNQQ